MRGVEGVLSNGSAGISQFRVGDWVEVRSKDEILKTLDRNGRLDEMPFMPEMFAFCGKRFRVFKRAHKTCDTVYEYKGRRMRDAVHLEGTRCDGQSHGGCQASCLIFWKTAWLRPIDRRDGDSRLPEPGLNMQRGGRCTEADVLTGTRRGVDEAAGPAYVCQATQVPAATEPLRSWDWRQYLEDVTSGNVSVGRIAKTFAYMAYRHWLVNLGIGIGPVLKWSYDAVQRLRNGTPYAHRTGKIPSGVRTPSTILNLRQGELVRVKSFDAILESCDRSNMNRGMTFDPEMVPYCGGTYRVLKRVNRIINEKTGQMQEMKNPCIILDGVVCEARYADCRPFCPRSVYPYWRETWLERVEVLFPAAGANGADGDVAARRCESPHSRSDQ